MRVGIRSAFRTHAPLVLWMVLGALAMLIVFGVMKRTADTQLRSDAQGAALNWAAFLTRTVPDLDLIFDGDLPSPVAQTHLSALRAANEVFRFSLYSAQGRLLLVSDSLGKAPPGDLAEAVNHKARDAAAQDAPHVELLRGDGRAMPQVYSEAYVPVHLGGRVQGVVEVHVDQSARAARIESAFVAVATAVLLVLLGLFAVGGWQWLRHARNKRAAEDRVRYLAHHDVLTSALNRASFEEALQQEGWRRTQGGASFAVLCIDLDGFKEVNDTLGHPAGDEMLRQVAARLRDTVRNADLVARLGGDEFAVLQTGVQGSEDVATLAQRVAQALALPYDLAGQRVPGGASVGAAIHGVDATDTHELMHRADLALYRAKTQGRGGYSFYDAGLDEQLQHRRVLTRELKDALAHGELALHYQPLYGADGRTLCGYEALARWPHPRRGFVPPSEFIALAEETGMIDELGVWVLRQACAEAARWPAPLSVAVNLSAAQFRHEGALIDEVSRTLAASGLAPQRLELEITESLLMTNTDQVLAALQRLHAMGVRIAMDDFGTGYSSLAYLWRFPFDKVKIDRAFTQNMNSDAKASFIVKSIVSLAHSLDIRVNAEGVETDAQMQLLRDHGCDELQGYLLGRPAPPDRLAHLPAPPAGQLQPSPLAAPSPA
jgi:diguanylate cyclase (GGDEF)-like protein